MTERVEHEAAEAWGRYQSTVVTGGTPEQRRWAFERANHAEDRLAEHQRDEHARRARADTDKLPAVKA